MYSLSQYCAMGLGWFGLGFRGFLPPLFEEAVINLFFKNINTTLVNFQAYSYLFLYTSDVIVFMLIEGKSENGEAPWKGAESVKSWHKMNQFRSMADAKNLLQYMTNSLNSLAYARISDQLFVNFPDARTSGVLKQAKDKLEKHMEELTLRLQLKKRLRLEVSFNGGKVSNYISNAAHFVIMSIPWFHVEFDTIVKSNGLMKSEQDTILAQAQQHIAMQEVDINKKTENQAKMTKLSMEWKRLCKIKAKVQKCQSQSQYRRISSQTGAGTEEYY
ncbi:hypothetical protein Tco_0599772 [Tanacetum coccineum]